MTTPENDHIPERRCTCASNVEGTNVDIHEKLIVSIAPVVHTSSIEYPSPPPTTTSGVLRSRDLPFESLKCVLSSGDGRESLYALATEQAIRVIDALEQGSREDSPLCAHHQKRFSMVLRKMCREHKLLPPSYMVTDELNRTGEYPYGGGGSADVWDGVYRDSRVAIKVLRVNSKVDLVSLEKKFCGEVVLWKQFKHPNLLPLVGAKIAPQTLMMISEWMEHGTIRDFVRACPEANRLKLLADVARGLKYLHDWPSVHADLKSSNILIDNDRSARIADFGLTSLLPHPFISISMTAPALGGTLPWMAPELLDGTSPPSSESDIYALGMVAYEVFAHERPFHHVPSYAAPGLVLAGKQPSRPPNRDILGLSEEVWKMTEQCWDRDPGPRPHVADLLDLFETASRSWAPPTPEAIANLGLDRPASQNPPMMKSPDTTSTFQRSHLGRSEVVL